jgi:hypothetical protein
VTTQKFILLLAAPYDDETVGALEDKLVAL